MTLEGVREKHTGQEGEPRTHVVPIGGHCFPAEILHLATTIGRPERRPCQVHNMNTLYQEATGNDLPK